MIDASILRQTAKKRLEDDREQLEAWVEEAADAAAEWCQEDADEGRFSSTIESKDFNHLIPPDVPKESQFGVLVLVKKTLEGYGYKVDLDNYDPKGKSEGTTVHRITIDWSGEDK